MVVDLTGKMKNRRRLSGTDLVSRFFALRERAEEIADQKPQCVHRSGRVKVRTGCQTEQPYRFKDVPYSMRVTYMSKILPFITTRWLVLVPSLLEAPLGGPDGTACQLIVCLGGRCAASDAEGSTPHHLMACVISTAANVLF